MTGAPKHLTPLPPSLRGKGEQSSGKGENRARPFRLLLLRLGQFGGLGSGFQTLSFQGAALHCQFILLLQDVISRRRGLHRVVRITFLLWTLVWLGWYAGAQITVVNLITYIHTLVTDFRWNYLLADPLVAILSAFTISPTFERGLERGA